MPADPTHNIHAKRTIDSSIHLVPSKRRKLEQTNGANEPSEGSSSKPSGSQVKREPSPTPPPSFTPRTSGTVRVDLPHNCRKTQSGWKERRDKWVIEETEKLKDLGLRVPKRIIREDGLALDWVSSAPVCPLTLKPPSPVVHLNGEEARQSPEMMVSPTLDPLGHALRDQTISTRPTTQAHQSSVKTHAAKADACAPSRLVPEESPAASADFVVVGAALLKDHPGSGSEPASGPASDNSIQLEHRKLLPPDLRPSAQLQFYGGETARDRKQRRIAWIGKEIEKVEGYTGEKVAGFQYDGDDIIIHLRKKRHGQKNELQPPRRNRTQSHAPHLPIASISPTLNASVSAGLSTTTQECLAGGTTHHRRTSLTKSTSDRAAGDACPSGNPLPQLDPQTVNTNTIQTERTTSPVVFPDSTTDLTDTTVLDGVGVTQARGLGFLEHYLQLFDSDREALTLAYTPNATFSLTEDLYGSLNTAPTTIERPQQIVKTGQRPIIEVLKKIGPHLHHSPFADITYNIATLEDMSPGGLLLTCEGSLVPVDHSKYLQGTHWFFSRIFVLKQNVEDSRQTWPLQIAAEKLTIQRRRNNAARV